MIVLKYNGKISEWDYNEITIGDEVISRDIFDTFDVGDKINLRYFISEEPIDENNIEEQYLKCLYGNLDGKYIPILGSEWTGWYMTEEKVEIDGHDLLAELETYIGKYCYLEIKAQ